MAMGSSFAAGPGVGRRVAGSPRAAGRSSDNYAHLVARRFGLALDDVTYSGATTQDILVATALGRPAQVDAVTGPTKLVTITCGGNDVGYASRILLSSLPRPLPAVPSVRRRLASFADPELTEERFGTLRENLARIAAQVRERAPDCRLVFVDYLTVLPPDRTTPTGLLPAEVAEWGRRVRPAVRGHAGGRCGQRQRLRGRRGGQRRSPRLVCGALDQAVPPLAAGRRAVPSQRAGHGGRGRPDRRHPASLIRHSLIPPPCKPDPALPDPASPDPALPDPASPDPALPDPASPDPASPDPALP